MFLNRFRNWFQSLKPHVCDEDLFINVNGCFDPNCPIIRVRKPLPKVIPQPPPPPPRYA